MGAWLEKCILSGGSRGEAGGRAGSPLFLDHNEARWAENVFLETARTPSPPQLIWRSGSATDSSDQMRSKYDNSVDCERGFYLSLRANYPFQVVSKATTRKCTSKDPGPKGLSSPVAVPVIRDFS